MIANGVLLVVSLLLLTAGAESLVRGAVGIATRLGVSSFFIGLTIVGFGTSTPELCASLVAAAKGAGDLSVGNAVGSNIFNIAVILGLTALICPIALRIELVRREVLVVIGVACVPMVSLTTGGRIERWMGVLMLSCLLVYLWRGYIAGRTQSRTESGADTVAAAEAELERELAITGRGWLGRPAMHAAFVVIGLGLLVGGSWLLVRSATDIARSLGVSDLVIGLTVVAAGTSAPELVTSLVAALRRQPDISVGNILGSNIFNILGILGLTCVFAPQTAGRQTLLLDVPLMIALSVACLPIMLSGARISRAEGVLLLGVYAVYVWTLFAWAPAWFAAA